MKKEMKGNKETLQSTKMHSNCGCILMEIEAPLLWDLP